MLMTRLEGVKWVAQSNRPMRIVADKGLKRLLKIGRPHFYVPSPSTVSRDVRTTFMEAQVKIALKLQACEGKLSFQMDAWTSPNHKAYVGIMVGFKDKGKVNVLVLDVVKVAKVCFGSIVPCASLADEFTSRILVKPSQRRSKQRRTCMESPRKFWASR